MIGFLSTTSSRQVKSTPMHGVVGMSESGGSGEESSVGGDVLGDGGEDGSECVGVGGGEGEVDTGPSFTIPTSIMAWNTPSFTLSSW